MKNIVLLVHLFILFSGCQETKRIFIADHLVDCMGVGPQKCMLLKGNSSEEWTYFYDTIAGFEYEQGYEYELEVTIKKNENPLADASTLSYTLVKIISKQKHQAVAQKLPLQITKVQGEPLFIEYQAISRGSFFQVKIDSSHITKTTDRNLTNVTAIPCDKKDWKQLCLLLKPIQLEKINQLPPPTNKRHTDAAKYARLKITYPSKNYTSSDFDHSNPPSALKQLVNTMLSLAESIE